MTETANAAATPGAILAQERVRQNLSIAEVAAKLRISIRQIEAMEADQYDKLPGVTFVRGFMRNYARLLHLDPEPLLQASGMGANTLADLAAGGASHQQIRLSPEPRGSVGSSNGRRKPAGVIIGVAIAGLLAWWLWQQWANRARTPQSAQPVQTQPAASGDSISIPVVIPGAGQGINAPSVPPAAPGTSVPVPLPNVPSAAGAPAAATASATAPAGEGKPENAAPAPIGVIRFEFNAAARVEVRDKNNFAIHEELHQPSDITEIQVRPPVNLVIGNAKSVKMSFNGRPIDLTPHIDASVARFTFSDTE
jgi:cytoskeleton protein RodZ